MSKIANKIGTFVLVSLLTALTITATYLGISRFQ